MLLVKRITAPAHSLLYKKTLCLLFQNVRYSPKSQFNNSEGLLSRKLLLLASVNIAKMSSRNNDSSTGFVSWAKSKLNFLGTSEQILEEVSVEGISKYIKSGKCKNIIVMAGSGTSAAAGIPDVRFIATNLYTTLKDTHDMNGPQDIFNLDYFKKNPKPFYALFKQYLRDECYPTASHYFIKMLEDKGLLLRHYAQNVDGLERKAGVSDEKIVEAHGSFFRSRCLGCNAEYPLDWIKDMIRDEVMPVCGKCDNIVKPNVLFYGESPPPEIEDSAKKDFMKCDLLIVMGTSLAAEPFASWVDNVPADCPRLLINLEKVMHNESSSPNRKGFNFDNDLRNRDVALIGNVEDGVMKLATSLGWEKDLQNLIDSNLRRSK